MDYTKLTYRQLRHGYGQKDFLPSEVLDAYIARIETLRDLNVFLTETLDTAKAQALDSDARFQSGTARPLEGLPFSIKDIFCTQGVRTTCGSAILENFVPFYESTITQRLKDAGVIALGKTNMDEFAMGSSNETSAFGPCISPLISKSDPAKKLIPGGSSGGSAASVLARMCVGSIGTDTGGSIRQPASFCGIVGLKPTYGRCSRYGVIGFASSLDHAGPLARTVEDTMDLFAQMSGHDPKDATTAVLPPFQLQHPLNTPLKGLKVGIPKEYRDEGLDAEVQTYWDKTAQFLKDQGAEIIDVSLPHTHYGLPTYYIIAPAEASSNLARYDGVRYGLRAEGADLNALYTNTRSQFFGEEVKRRILVGTYVLSSGAYEDFYLRSLQVRRLVREEFKSVFKKVDVLLTPTTPSTAFGLGEKLQNPMAMYLSDVFTVGANLAGIPALSVPVGLSTDGLPIGMQIMAGDFQEELLFRVGKQIEDQVVGITDLFQGAGT